MTGVLRLRPPSFLNLKKLFSMLKDMDILSLHIQGSEISMLDIRVQFDVLIEEYGDIYPSLIEYLNPSAEIIESEHVD